MRYREIAGGPQIVTRLQSDDISYIINNLNQYDEELIGKTGRNLRGIAFKAAGINEKRAKALIDSMKIGVVPVTSGKGMISGFSETVKEIANHIGFSAFLTRKMDVAGIAEAFEKKCTVIMLADDDRFVACNLKRGLVVDNADATAGGYVSGLELMVGSLKGRKVLVIGCGRVGMSAVGKLIKIGATVSLYDINKHVSSTTAENIRNVLKIDVNVEEDLREALLKHKLWLDATPAKEIIDGSVITPETYVSAPGVPCCLSADSRELISDRILHDPLQIGVATMLIEAACV